MIPLTITAPLVEIVRLDRTAWYTLGVLRINGNMVATTLELPWRDNLRDVSCIPANIEVIAHRETALSTGICPDGIGWVIPEGQIPGRDRIIVGHVGNYVRNTQGCPLVGTGVLQDHDDGLPMITQSGDAYRRIQRWLGDAPTIRVRIINK